MAAMVVAGAPAQLLRDRVRIVPVPGDPWRTRKRGLDHSLLLANAIGRRAGLDVSAPLVRQRSARQAGKGRRERLAGPAIGVRKGAVVEGSYVLIDDVHTTGATLHAAAVALRRAGACHVDAATFGRTR
jgi:predicted amidophosphoribosyltransferase